MRTKTLVIALFALVVAVGLPALAVPAQAQTVQPGFLRIVNATTGTQALDVYLDGEAAATNLEVGSATDIVAMDPGPYTVTVRGAGEVAGNEMLEAEVVVARGRVGEVVLTGEFGVPGAGRMYLGYFLLNMSPTEGRSRIYVIHASPDAGAVDVLGGARTLITELEYLQMSAPLLVRAGTYSYGVAPSGSTEPVISLDGLDAEADMIYTVIVYGLAGEDTLQTLILVTDVAAPAAS